MKNECSLCGGKVRNGICTECGMDNRKTDKMYKLNQEDCGEKSLSHVHKEDKVEQYRAPVMNKTRETKTAYEQKSSASSRKKSVKPSGSYSRQYISYSRNGNKRKKGPVLAVLIAAIIIMISVIITAIGAINQYTDEGNVAKLYRVPEGEWEEIEPIAPTEELNPKGDTWEQKLEAGMYIVGVDLPEGTYEITGEEGSSFQISDARHAAYMTERFGTEEGNISGIEEVPLYKDAIIYVDGMRLVTFKTENGQVQEMTPRQENPLKETVEITGQASAGTDFPAGTYDVVVTGEGFGVFKYEIPQEGENAYPLSFSVLMEGSPSEEYPEYSRIYKNVALPEGAVINADEFTVNLLPSAGIVSEDYMSCYDNMY